MMENKEIINECYGGVDTSSDTETTTTTHETTDVPCKNQQRNDMLMMISLCL